MRSGIGHFSPLFVRTDDDTEGCPAITRWTPLGSRYYLLRTPGITEQKLWLLPPQLPAVLICRIGAWPGKYSVVGVEPLPLDCGAVATVMVLPLMFVMVP